MSEDTICGTHMAGIIWAHCDVYATLPLQLGLKILETGK
jgi:hypothetical protein